VIKEKSNYPTSGDKTPMNRNNRKIRFALRVKLIQRKNIQ